ncbi:TonB-dependent receptor plug domain-containing protein [Erythrobacter sp. 3-20A1M]|uniref:TonB-dependent receptor domain-containing protein n=1 Tax=Erythrobacter sp. 3-20A1M TaxID=2653850 RepID=UPI001BFC595F|nr:TonB-dependent receptor [Erythrobacter sp. 3-20A1M]QWC57295.1 TonB-dependent receptor plug domain-containing protein [Erythrobacter sp. 3-20A1M]
MSTTSRVAGVLLLTTALTCPALAHAQTDPATTSSAPQADIPTDQGDQPEPVPQDEEVEVSVPGQSNVIVVTGRRDRNVMRSSDQVVSILSSADIARTGEGDIAGALSRVTGLSVVGSGFVYVRGLGDRYSLALLNGSPLPSPEPLKRVVPLDLFPTGIVASSLVQKSYSANFPGEFGGGVINLTTKATPDEPFLTIGGGISGDTYTTGNLGYTYYGSDSDWTGYDNGNRKVPPGLQDYFDQGLLFGTDPVDSTAIARQLITFKNTVVQKMNDTPVNVSASLSAGKTFPVGAMDLGVIAAAGYSNSFLTRTIRQQRSSSANLASIESDFLNVTTDQKTTVNGLLGFGLEFGDSRVRWTNLYIHDTIKKAGLSLGQRPAQRGDTDFLRQRTAWYERQLIDTQLVGEFRLSEIFGLEVRGGYANTQREAPDEITFEYDRSNAEADPFGQYFVNRLNNGNGGDGEIAFSDLNEDLYSGGLDLTYNLAPSVTITAGGAYSDTKRRSSRRNFLLLAPNTFLGDANVISGIGLLRPDLLVATLTDPAFVDANNGNGLELIETDPGTPVFDAELEIAAGYLKGNFLFGDTISLDAGVRYEDATQTTTPVETFVSVPPSIPPTQLDRSYWLPAATLTFDLDGGKQIRLNASKTIARPQFRELIAQPYYDPESNQPYLGNPLLVDSQLYNAEARFEWYYAPEQRLSVSGFYKRIENPIEAYVSFFGGDFVVSYANAPSADLYGAELELVKYFDLSEMGGMLSTRRAVVIGNYTYTQSNISVEAGDTTAIYGAASSNATDYFRDGSPLTGQSDHIVNFQLGLEDEDRLSQQTILLSYASNRVVARGLNGSTPQPDVIEKPGLQVDFVWREGFSVFGTELEAKFEARNIFGTDHEEFQKSDDARIEYNSWDVGTRLALSLSAKF